MCFSAEASFGVSVVLAGGGVAALKSVRQPSQVLFAGIPLVFAVQQFTEGLIWLMVGRPEYAAQQKVLAYIFLVLAEVLWPVIVPLAVYWMEPDDKKKRLGRYLVLAGICPGLYYAQSLTFGAYYLEAARYHIRYQNVTPGTMGVLFAIMYGIAIIVPLLISSVKGMFWIGLLVLLSMIGTLLFFGPYLTSVWCFFAAVISVLIYFIVKKTNC